MRSANFAAFLIDRHWAASRLRTLLKAEQRSPTSDLTPQWLARLVPLVLGQPEGNPRPL
jgi:hypothetical protein